MNLCLASVAPSLFLLLEVRFGSSTLQNYDGILRNQILGSKLSLTWRCVLSVMLALPLGLSVAYKTFTGGRSVMHVDSTKFVGNASQYGMFAPPGLQLLGQQTGISLFADATLPFAVASSSQNGSEPPLPMHRQTYGFNVLSLDNQSTAILDIPEPNYISAVQGLLADGESWDVITQILATVASFNNSRSKDPTLFVSDFKRFCEAAGDSSGALSHMSMMNQFSVDLISNPSPGDQSIQYVALAPDPGIEYTPSCSNLSYYVQPYHIDRQTCMGTWTITRGAIQLVDGSCQGPIPFPEKQQVITNNNLFLGVWYMSSLAEFLGPFATTRNQSMWEGLYMATGMAAMSWSRVTVHAGAGKINGGANIPQTFTNITDEDAGLICPVNDTVVYARPTLQKSSLLYFVLTIQPLVTVLILVLAPIFHSTPVDRGFGLISILSGIESESLDILAGATLSGKLAQRVQLVMQPKYNGRDGMIEYRCLACHSMGPGKSNGKVTPGITYH